MKASKLAVVLCIMLLCGVLIVLGIRATADTPSEPQRAEANIRVLAFATETLKSQLSPAEFAAWPIPLRDTLTYWLGYQPYSEWSPVLQQLARKKFEEEANTPRPSSGPEGEALRSAIARWLKEPATFENAQLHFMLNTQLSLSVPGSSPRSGLAIVGGEIVHLYQLTEKQSPYDIQQLSHFLSSLSQVQKEELWAGRMRLSVSRLNQEQKLALKSMFADSPIRVAGRPLWEHEDAKITVDFQFGASAKRLVNDKEEYWYTLIARPFDYLHSE